MLQFSLPYYYQQGARLFFWSPNWRQPSSRDHVNKSHIRSFAYEENTCLCSSRKNTSVSFLYWENTNSRLDALVMRIGTWTCVERPRRSTLLIEMKTGWKNSPLICILCVRALKMNWWAKIKRSSRGGRDNIWLELVLFGSWKRKLNTLKTFKEITF